MTATSALDPATLKLGSSLHMRHRHPTFVFFRYLYLLLIPIGCLLLYFGDRTFGIACLLIGPFLFIRKIFWQFRLIKSAKSSSHTEDQLHWTFSEEGFHQKSKKHDSTFTWDQVTERHLSPKGILLYLSKEQYFILPGTAFGSQKDFEEVTRLIQKKTAQP